ncbi:hypothetical protein C1708_04460 [Streptomyces sp. DH-12]|nr:hypothetical protein C1708_04460 [Streptomyces sp. DH-12]
MTQVTPPGWYPDPGQTQDGPPTERWWDGTAWTARIRRPDRAAQTTPEGGGAERAAEAGPAGADQAQAGQADPDQVPAGQAAAGQAVGRTGAGEAAGGRTGAGHAAENRGSAGQTDAEHAAAGQTGDSHADAGQAATGHAPVNQGDASPAAGGRAAPWQVPASGPGAGQGAVREAAGVSGGGSPGHPTYPVHPAYPATPSSGRGRKLRIGIAVAVAAAVLASIGVGVYALTDDDGGRTTAASQHDDRDAPGGGPDDGSGADGEDDGEDGGDGDDPRRVESGSVTDSLSGISLPVPEGWYGEELQIGAALTSKDSYDCPGDTSKTCVKGGAYSAPAVVLGTRGATAEEVAKADIAANAEESYGGESYGRITSHDVLVSKAVTVAGQKGYLVRWKAVTQEGSDGFVQSLAFPSPARPDQIVVVRFGVDTDQRQTVLDEITEGIAVAEGGRGNGQDV